MTDQQNTQDREIVISRDYKAPRELVFRVWTDAAHLAKWWGPKGMNMNICKLDLRPGGMFHYSMMAPNGMEMWGRFEYREILPPEKIVFVNAFSDREGGITRNPFMPQWPLEVLNTVTFTEAGGVTTITFRGHPINATEEEMTAFKNSVGALHQGFKGTFDQLEAYLAEI